MNDTTAGVNNIEAAILLAGLLSMFVFIGVLIYFAFALVMPFEIEKANLSLQCLKMNFGDNWTKGLIFDLQKQCLNPPYNSGK